MIAIRHFKFGPFYVPLLKSSDFTRMYNLIYVNERRPSSSVLSWNNYSIVGNAICWQSFLQTTRLIDWRNLIG